MERHQPAHRPVQHEHGLPRQDEDGADAEIDKQSSAHHVATCIIQSVPITTYPEPTCAGAHKFCDGCNFDKSVPHAKEAFSFLRKGPQGCCKWKLRDTRVTVRKLKYAFTKGRFNITQRKAYLRRNGLQSTLTTVCARRHTAIVR